MNITINKVQEQQQKQQTTQKQNKEYNHKTEGIKETKMGQGNKAINR